MKINRDRIPKMKSTSCPNSSTLTLTNLKGRAQSRIHSSFARSITAALTACYECATTSAGPNGSINVWVDDDGNYRASFSRYLSTVREETFTTKSELRIWLHEWFPRMRNADASPSRS